MADSIPQPTQPVESPAPAAPAPQPASAPAVTPDIQAMIESARREAYNSGAADTRRALAGKPPRQPATTTATEQPDQAPAPSVDALSLIRLRDEFDDATADLNLGGQQRRFLREQVMSQRPANVSDFVRQFVSVWGGPPAPQSPHQVTANHQAPPTTAPTATAQLTAPVTAGSPPPPPPAVRTDQRIVDMTPRDRAALAKSIGTMAFRDRLYSEIASTRIEFGRR